MNKVWYAPNQKQAYGQEEIDAVVKALESGWLAPGLLTEEFEIKVANLFGKRLGVMVNSGSSANTIALRLAGVGAGDEVITPACTFATTVAPIVQLGATPSFVDVTPGKYVPEVGVVLQSITEKTKAIMLPNLIGNKPDWLRLRLGLNRLGKKVTLIEDSCDTITLTEDSDITTTSFYASHIITAGGAGGVVMFNDDRVRAKALTLRDWGRRGNNSEEMQDRFTGDIDGISYDGKFLYDEVGYNFKATEMQAAFGLAQLKKLDQFIKTRRSNFNRYLENLKGTDFILPIEDGEQNWLAFPLMHPKRTEIMKYLEARDIQTRVLFAGNVTRHPAFRQYLKEFPGADRIMREGFLVGCHQGMGTEDVDRVCAKLKEAAA